MDDFLNDLKNTETALEILQDYFHERGVEKNYDLASRGLYNIRHVLQNINKVSEPDAERWRYFIKTANMENTGIVDNGNAQWRFILETKRIEASDFLLSLDIDIAQSKMRPHPAKKPYRIDDRHTIFLKDALDSTYALSNDQGEKISMAVAELLIQDQKIQISFLGVERVGIAFMNAAFGSLYSHFDVTTIQTLMLPPIDIQARHAALLKMVTDNAKKQFGFEE